MFFLSPFQKHSVNPSILQTASGALTDEMKCCWTLVIMWMVVGEESYALACEMHKDTSQPVGRVRWSQ